LDLRRFVSARGFYARDAVVTAMEEDSRPVKEGKGRPARMGKVVFDPCGDFGGKTFKLEEIRAMVKNGALETGTIYELDGKRFTV